jgi:type IV secretion system protein VirD4
MARVLPPPATIKLPPVRQDEWSGRAAIQPAIPIAVPAASTEVSTLAGPERRKVPELTPPPKPKGPETMPLDFGPASTELEDRVKRLQSRQRAQQQTARQASLDPNDGIDL